MFRAINSALLSIACVLTLAACQPKAVDTTADKAALMTAADGWEKAYNDKNAEAVAAIYAEDAELMPPGVPRVQGKAAIKEFFEKDIATNWAKFSVKADSSEVSGDWGWRSGTWSLVDMTPGITGKYVEVWHRTTDGWKVQRDIWNADALPSSAAPPAAPAATAAQ